MSPTLAIIIAVVGVIVFLVGIILAARANEAQKTFEQAQQALEEERAALKNKAALKSTGTRTAREVEPAQAAAPVVVSSDAEEELKQQLQEVRAKLEKQRQKTHDISRERDALRKKSKSRQEGAASGALDQVALVDLRMELSEAKAQVEQYKVEVSALQKAQKSRPAKPAPVEEPAEPVEVAKPVELPEPKADDTEDIKALRDEYKQKVREAEDKGRQEAGELREKLKRSGRESDNQRRRADNNDKAYRITQRELDAAREHVTLLNEQLKRARFAATSAQEAGDVAQPSAKATPQAEPVKPAPQAAVSPVTSEDQPQKAADADTIQEPTHSLQDDATIEVDPAIMDAVAELSADTGVAPGEQGPDMGEDREELEGSEVAEPAVSEEAEDAPSEVAPVSQEASQEETPSEEVEAAEEVSSQGAMPAHEPAAQDVDEPAVVDAQETPEAAPEAAPEEPGEDEPRKATPAAADTTVDPGLEVHPTSLDEPSVVDEAWADLDIDGDI